MDYSKLNLKIGLEVHQQLETHKLFCDCPSILRDDEPDIKVRRKLRAIAGETGEIDIAAMHEMQRGVENVYEAYKDTTCLVELDEMPVRSLNKEALETALQVAMLLNADIVDEVHIMRKIVVDGSNTSGFQRTCLIARNGYIETSLGRVGIGYVFLEEEAARNIKEERHLRVWRLDRLGIPLIEIQTKPDIKTPDHAKEVAEKLGMILRSTGRVKHGIGTIRQDINLSIKGLPRVEIKGFQDLKAIPKVIGYEINRQLKLDKIIAEVRRANPDNTTSFMRPMPGAARLYPETDTKLVKIVKEMLTSVKKPELLTEKAMKLEKAYNISPEIAKGILKQNIGFEDLVSRFKNIEPSFIAHALIEHPKEIRKRYDVNTKNITKEHYMEILGYLDSGAISRDAVFELLIDAANGKKLDVAKYKTVPDSELEKDIRGVVAKNKGASFNAVMGEVMKKYRGRVDGKRIAELVKRFT